MSSRHDTLTAVITVVLVAALVTLSITHNLTGTLLTGFIAALSGMVAYWFTRGGNQMSSGNSSTTSNLTQAAEAGASAALDKLANTPAQSGSGSSANSSQS